MKLYTFLNNKEEIIVEVRAENHDRAVVAASYNDHVIDYSTDYYSETIEDEENSFDAW